MQDIKAAFADLVSDTVTAGVCKKLVFSKPENGKGKITGRVVTHKGNTLLALEREAGDGKVYHENLPEENIAAGVFAHMPEYMQINLVTACGDAEYRRNKKGNEVLLGEKPLRERMEKERGSFADALTETLSRKKNYILSGDEPFLRALDIADATGRIHDKKQAKFRQINRFLEHIRDIEPALPAEGKLLIYDLCCGKSYLSFAVYHYFHVLRGREVEMLGMDLKDDCMTFCRSVAAAVGFDGMTFVTGDIRTVPKDRAPHLVLSLHACDIATDIVLHFAAAVRAGVILSTPCCQHDLLTKVDVPALSFVTDYPKLSGKLCEALTDALRLSRLRTFGYRVTALELTDPDDTPKNTLLRAVRDPAFREDSREAEKRREEYRAALRYVLGKDASDYPEDLGI